MARLFNTTATTAEEAFRAIDTNQSGSLDAAELRAAMTQAGAKAWPLARIQFAVEKFDQNKNGKLDMNEFKQLLSYLECGVVVQPELDHVWRLVEALRGRVTELEASHDPRAEMRVKLGVLDEWIAQEMHKQDVHLVVYEGGEVVAQATAVDWKYKAKGQTSDAIFRCTAGLGRYYHDSTERLLLQHVNTAARPKERGWRHTDAPPVWALAMSANEYVSLAKEALASDKLLIHQDPPGHQTQLPYYTEMFFLVEHGEVRSRAF